MIIISIFSTEINIYKFHGTGIGLLVKSVPLYNCSGCSQYSKRCTTRSPHCYKTEHTETTVQKQNGDNQKKP